jgi:hypothetical protein
MLKGINRWKFCFSFDILNLGLRELPWTQRKEWMGKGVRRK